MEHRDYQELLPARALDALDGEELRMLDQHLPTCAECRAALVEWSDDANMLAFAAPPVEPGAETGKRIMERIHERWVNPAEAPAEVVQMTQRRAARQPVWLQLAAAIVFVALMIGVIVLWGRNARMRYELARLSDEVKTQQRELARDRGRLQQERDAVAMLTSPDARRSEMAGTKEAKDARATFAFDRQTGHAMLMTSGLPTLPAGMAYELWFIADGRPMPGKVFKVDESGKAMISDQVPAEARDKAVFAITMEPERGVQSPTGAIYLSSPSS